MILWMKYVRVYSAEDGQARFEDLEFRLAPTNFVPHAAPVNLSDPLSASAFMIMQVPAGWTEAAHPSPARQFVIFLSGSGEGTAGSETRSFSAGDVVLLEDTSGQGHVLSAVEDMTLAVVQLGVQNP